jgi:quaternary ammonium compound-resistance protein SugE
LGWVYVVIAGLFEIGFTTAMKESAGFSRIVPSLIFGVCTLLSFFFLTRAIEHLPLGTAYAVWVGIGAAGTAAVGILIYGESAEAMRMVFLGLLVASIIGLKIVS